MNRRTFIATAALTCVAGCSNATRESNRSQPEPRDESVDETSVDSAVDPTVPTVGDTYTHPDGMAVTLVSTRLTGNIRLEDATPLRPGVSGTFLIANVQATNTGNSTVDLPSLDSFNLSLDEHQSSPRDFAYQYQSSFVIDFPVSGQQYRGVSDAEPGVSTSGWLVFEVPSNLTDYRLSLSEESSDTAMAEWQGRVDPDSLPELSVTSVDVPAEHPAGDPLEISISIENTGGSAGLYSKRYFITRERVGRSRGEFLQTIVNPGETITVDESIEAHLEQDITISVPGYPDQTVSVVSSDTPRTESTRSDRPSR